MRLGISKSKNSESLYVIKSTYENKVHSTKIIEKLGTVEELKKKLNGGDPYEWAKEYVAELNRQEKEGKEPDVIAKYSPHKQLEKGTQQSVSGGYLFLQKLYHELGMDRICTQIKKRHTFEYDFDSILSRLLYTRILYPGSKRSCNELSKHFIEPPSFNLHQIYRALDVINKERDFIQSEVYKNSVKLSKRNTGILYYDCTNFFFEAEEESGLRQYGLSKEHRPNPIVQLGLFMDGDGIPLAFCINSGNMNEQGTLKPLEKQILADFELSKFVVCTDAGLSSYANRDYNSKGGRGFITTQSLKKLNKPLQEWALEPMGWHVQGSQKSYDIRTLDEDKDSESIFYKEQWVVLDDVKQRLVVTYSIAHRDYMRSVRQGQVNRLIKTIEENPSRLSKVNQNDARRFLSKISCTKDGEIATQTIYGLNMEAVEKEAQYDGFYAVCTNLSDDVSAIVAVNKRRWEIEECFRIMKSEFKARPVFVNRDERIQAHFMTCFLSLILYRFLEKRLDNKYTCHEIISEMQNMNFKIVPDSGYAPNYTRTDFTDALHNAFGFRTDYEIVTRKEMKRILKTTKK